MNAAIEANDIQPVVDRTFAMDEVQEAYQYQADQAHVGKVVISLIEGSWVLWQQNLWKDLYGGGLRHGNEAPVPAYAD